MKKNKFIKLLLGLILSLLIFDALQNPADFIAGFKDALFIGK